MNMNYHNLNLTNCGIVLMMILYAIVSFVVHRHKLYFYFLIYIALEFFIFFIFDEKMPSLLFHLIQILAQIAYLVFIFSTLANIRHYENWRFHKLKGKSYFRFIVIYITIGICLPLIFHHYLGNYWFYFSVPLCVMPLAILILYKMFHDRFSIIIPSLLGAILFYVCFFITVMPPFYAIKYNLDYNYFAKISLITQGFFMINGMIFLQETRWSEKEKVQKKLYEQMAENEKNLQKIQKNREEIKGNLHDDVGSQLSLISALSQAACLFLGVDDLKAMKYLNDIQNSIGIISPKLRNIVLGENEIDLSEININELFTDMASIIFDNTEIEYVQNLPSPSSWEHYSNDFKNQIFLIYKEILVNIIHHAQAKNVAIVLNINKNKFNMIIHDDGIGFNTKLPSTGHGLFSIKKRIENLNGTTTITSQIGMGTQFDIEIG